MIDLNKIKAHNPRLAAACYNTLAELQLLAPTFDALLDAVVEQMSAPPPKMQDLRRQNAMRAIHWLVQRNVLLVNNSGHVFECDESAWNLPPSRLPDEPKGESTVLSTVTDRLRAFIHKHGRAPNMLLLSSEAASVLHAELGLWPRGGSSLLGAQRILGMQPLIVPSFTRATVQVGLVE